MGTVYCNGEFLPDAAASVPLFDRGFLYGEAVFETLRVYSSPSPFRTAEHLDRLRKSAALIGLSPGLSFRGDFLENLLMETSTRNGGADLLLRLSLTGGSDGTFGPRTWEGRAPGIYIAAKPFSGLPGNMFRNGVNISIGKLKKTSSSSMPAAAKTHNFLNSLLALREAEAAAAFETLLSTPDGSVAECAFSNVFVVNAGILQTPALNTGILPGITRGIVIQLAETAAAAIDSPIRKVSETRLSIEQVREADEIFLTSTSIEVLPVRSVDSIPVGGRTPGPVTCMLQDMFRKEVKETNE